MDRRVITGYYAKPTNYTTIGVSVGGGGGGGAQSPIKWQSVIASPQSFNNDGRATDSCFTLIGAHQCGVLLVDGDCMEAARGHQNEWMCTQCEGVCHKDTCLLLSC